MPQRLNARTVKIALVAYRDDGDVLNSSRSARWLERSLPAACSSVCNTASPT
jgi:hypothetical protein